MDSDGKKLCNKLQELNEEISAAVLVQQDAVGNASTFLGREVARKDAIRLAKKTTEWRDDVSALSKHIDLQLKNCRALRTEYAQSLLSPSDRKRQEETENSRLRCLRSDLRLLQEFRMHYSRQRYEKDTTPLVTIEKEMEQLKTFLDINVKKEKIGGNQEQSALALEIYEMRRDIMSRISEDFVKEKKRLDVEAGNLNALLSDGFGNIGMNEKDSLASWDAQLYALQNLQQEKRARLVANSQNSLIRFEEANGTDTTALELQAPLATKVQGLKFDSLLDDARIAMQKLEREVIELKLANSKLMLTNSQLVDDLSHSQGKFAEEKQAHITLKECILPKIQKMEDVSLITTKAFEEVKLSVELMTNMYKQLSSAMTLHQKSEDHLKQERDQVSLLLAEEIKKVTIFAKEIEHKDRLITLAMAARYESIQCANRHEKLAKEASDKQKNWKSHALKAEAEAEKYKLQLKEAFQRLDVTQEELSDAKKSITQLQDEAEATRQAAAIKEAELLADSDKIQAVLQQNLDKTKRELMESVAKMLNLDSRLRKAQERLMKKAADSNK